MYFLTVIYIIHFIFYPLEDCYISSDSVISSFGVPNFVKTFDNKTGNMTFQKPNFDFSFEDGLLKPEKGKQSRKWDSNLE